MTSFLFTIYIKFNSLLLDKKIKKPAFQELKAGQQPYTSGQKYRPGDVSARAGNARTVVKSSRYFRDSKKGTEVF